MKDTRLLASLADGVVGHTPGAIYPYLQQTNQLMNQVHEEATCDDVRDRLLERMETATRDTDLRGLMLLLSQVERRAAEVLDQPGLITTPWADRSVPRSPGPCRRSSGSA